MICGTSTKTQLEQLKSIYKVSLKLFLFQKL